MKRGLYLIAAVLIILAAQSALCGEGVSVSDHTSNMDQRKLFNAVGQTLDTRCLDTAGVTNSTTPQDLSWTDEFDYVIDNRLHSLAADAQYDLSAATPDVSVKNATCRIVVFHADADGTVNATAGSEVPWFTNATASYPASLPEQSCAFGAVKIINSSGQNFELGTTSFNASGVTSIFEDLSALPSLSLDE